MVLRLFRSLKRPREEEQLESQSLADRLAPAVADHLGPLREREQSVLLLTECSDEVFARVEFRAWASRQTNPRRSVKSLTDLRIVRSIEVGSGRVHKMLGRCAEHDECLVWCTIMLVQGTHAFVYESRKHIHNLAGS